MSEEKKKLYIVPGFKQSVEDENYKEIVNYAKEVGLEIKPVHVSWNHDIDMNDYIKEVSEQIPKESDDYILGFSFGAYISYLLSKEKRFTGYIFCTISPYFKETIEEIPRRAKEFFGSGKEADLLCKAVSNAWLAFAKTGNPNHEGIAYWPQYTKEARSTMLLGKECHVVDAPFESTRKLFDKIDQSEIGNL